MSVSNWGKYPRVEAPVSRYQGGGDLPDTHWIPRGMGRCYGDSSLGAHMISGLGLKRFLNFEASSGILTCEAGITFADLLETFVPKGWFPPVTPGTKFVSLGGAIASDVHGKNHHGEGSISRHILAFDLLLASGEMITCSPTQHADIFTATFGGMGLTGMVIRLTIQLKSIETSWIDMESVKARNLDEILDISEEFSETTYSMAWIDCLASGNKMGRSILMKGEHARIDQLTAKQREQPLAIPQKRKLNVPIDFPVFALNPLSIKAFNFLYYNKQFSPKIQTLIDYDSFFYPLDAIHNWNRIYGKRGFTQYQCTFPKETSREGLRAILDRTGRARMGSFLAVLKLFGKQTGMMSFPMEGYTLALDFPISKRIFPFLDELDEVVAELGGRVYLTKDARLQPEMLRRMYPNLDQFKALLTQLDPEGKVRSLQSERLGIHD